MNLHIISASPFTQTSPFQALPTMRREDTVLFIDDGCYSLHHSAFLAQLNDLGVNITVLEEHAQLRGIVIEKSIPSIDMAQFVDNAFNATHIFNWS